jgi:twitching motility protein PilI
VTYESTATKKSDVSSWLVPPSEALSRFAPTHTQRYRDIRTLTPARFGFRIGDIGLLVPIGMVSELIEESEIYPLPTTPDWYRGLMNLRGSLVPIFDLKILFEMRTGVVKPRLLVLNERSKAVGVLVDAAPKSVALGQPLPQTPPLPQLLAQYSQGSYVKNQDIWIEFDFDGFFMAVGKQLLA